MVVNMPAFLMRRPGRSCVISFFYSQCLAYCLVHLGCLATASKNHLFMDVFEERMETGYEGQRGDGGKMVGSEKEKKEGRMEEKKGRDGGRKERSHNDLCLWVKSL